MLSLSDNEFAVIGFLVRNFSERLTIRNMAQRLGFSAAGVFNILKKLEKEGIVYGEKLGTGLFYSMNFENKIAEHLAAITLVYSTEKIDPKILEHVKKYKGAILDKKNLLVLSDETATIQIEDLNIISVTEEEMISLLRKKDPRILSILKKGIVISKEMRFVDIIKNSVSRF